MRNRCATLAALALCAGCTGDGSADSGAEAEWYATDVLASAQWSRSGDEGVRGQAALTADGRAIAPDGIGRLYVESAPGVDPELAGPFASLDEALSTPVIAGEVVFVHARGELLALDLAAGSVRWQDTDGLPLIASPAGVELAVMARGGSDPAVRGRDPLTGDVVWTIEEDALAFAPLHAAADRVCGTQGTEVVLADAADGSELARVDPGLDARELRCFVDGGELLVLGVLDVDVGPDARLLRYDASGAELGRAAVDVMVGVPQLAVLRDDGVLVVSGPQETAMYEASTPALVDVWTDRAVRAVDAASGNMLYGSTLVDAEWQPLWRAEIEVPTNAYRFVGAVIDGERVVWTDAQDGVLGNDRWSRTLAFTAP